MSEQQQRNNVNVQSMPGKNTARLQTSITIVVIIIALVLGAVCGWYCTNRSMSKRIDDLESQNVTLTKANRQATHRLSRNEAEKDKIQEQLDLYTGIPAMEPDTMKACQILFDGDENLVKLNTSFLDGFIEGADEHAVTQSVAGAALGVKKLQKAYPYASPDMKASIASFNAPFLKVVYGAQGLEYGDSKFDKLQMLQDLTDIMKDCTDVGYTVNQ